MHYMTAVARDPQDRLIGLPFVFVVAPSLAYGPIPNLVHAATDNSYSVSARRSSNNIAVVFVSPERVIEVEFFNI